jgi:hypothetical protein
MQQAYVTQGIELADDDQSAPQMEGPRNPESIMDYDDMPPLMDEVVVQSDVLDWTTVPLHAFLVGPPTCGKAYIPNCHTYVSVKDATTTGRYMSPDDGPVKKHVVVKEVSVQGEVRTLAGERAEQDRLDRAALEAALEAHIDLHQIGEFSSARMGPPVAMRHRLAIATVRLDHLSLFEPKRAVPSLTEQEPNDEKEDLDRALARMAPADDDDVPELVENGLYE